MSALYGGSMQRPGCCFLCQQADSIAVNPVFDSAMEDP